MFHVKLGDLDKVECNSSKMWTSPGKKWKVKKPNSSLAKSSEKGLVTLGIYGIVIGKLFANNPEIMITWKTSCS